MIWTLLDTLLTIFFSAPTKLSASMPDSTMRGKLAADGGGSRGVVNVE